MTVRGRPPVSEYAVTRPEQSIVRRERPHTARLPAIYAPEAALGTDGRPCNYLGSQGERSRASQYADVLLRGERGVPASG